MKELDARAHATGKLQASVDISADAIFRVVVDHRTENWLYAQLEAPSSAALPPERLDDSLGKTWPNL